MYNETCLNRNLNKPESCIYLTLDKVPINDLFVNITCIDQNLSIPNTQVGPKEVWCRQVPLYLFLKAEIYSIVSLDQNKIRLNEECLQFQIKKKSFKTSIYLTELLCLTDWNPDFCLT